MRASGIGRSTIYKLLGDGCITGRKLGAKTLILDDELRQFISDLPRADIGNGRSAICGNVVDLHEQRSSPP